MANNNIDNLQKIIGVRFKDQSLLQKALVHRSFLNEPPGKKLSSNERLEFLGDAVLSYVISKWLYQEYPDYPEGHLTNIRSNLVKTESLAEIAQNLKIGEYLLLSKGEEKSGGSKNHSLLANTFEAIIGAIALDQGVDVADRLIRVMLLTRLEKTIKSGEFKEYKSVLQEKLQAKIKQSPIYKTIKEEGPDHAKTFTIGAYAQDKLIATGTGKNKKGAEEAAAKNALEKISPKG